MVHAEVGSGFKPPAILFTPKTFTLKTENFLEFNFCITATNKNSTNRFKVHTFSNGSPEDVLKWEKKMRTMCKCNLVDTTEGMFDILLRYSLREMP
eukprot:9339215-Ditylum_brightwellii.AAC.1